MLDKALHIIHRSAGVFAVLAVMLMIQGCDRSEPARSEPNADGVRIGFRIRLDRGYGTRSSRAGEESDPDSEPEYEYEEGTGFENYIGFEKGDLNFLLFDADGNFIERMALLRYEAAGEEGNPTAYDVTCRMSADPGETFRVVVLANWGAGNYPQENVLVRQAPISSLFGNPGSGNSLFAFSAQSGLPSESRPIPMYGVKTCNMKLKPSGPNDNPRETVNHIGELLLIRALAKVEVICSPAADEGGAPLTLGNVSLVNYNRTGYCAPFGMYDDTKYVSAPSIPAGGASAGETLPFALSDDRKRAVAYIPEYANADAAADSECRINLTFGNVCDPDKVYTIKFRKYGDDGKPSENPADRLDILRNCCYRFTVDLSGSFTVEVRPYGEVDLNPGFGWDWNESD